MIKIKIANEIVTEYQLQIIEDSSFSLCRNKKLIANLEVLKPCIKSNTELQIEVKKGNKIIKKKLN